MGAILFLAHRYIGVAFFSEYKALVLANIANGGYLVCKSYGYYVTAGLKAAGKPV